MTRFLCQELLYEYATGALEPSRARDVEQYLSTCADSRAELESLRKGLAYAGDLASIGVTDSLHAALTGFEPQWKKRVRGWTAWSSRRGWNILLILFISGGVGLGLYLTKPWRPKNPNTNKDVVMAEQSRPAATGESAGAAAAPSAPIQLGAGESGRVPTAVPASSAPVAPLHRSPAERPAKQDRSDESDEKKPTPDKGRLTHQVLAVTDFASVWPQVRDKVVALGGKPAGNVELGWLRRKNESYFHFSLPESNSAELEKYLKTLGPVQIRSDPHPRVMPAGQIRIILSVKGEDNGTDEDEAGAP